MKATQLFLTFFIMATLSVKGQVTLKIEISELKNSTGFIVLELRNGEDNFIKGITQQILNNKCIITVDSLKAGKYSFKYFHDKNSNNKLDIYWFGAPKEGYGFSNNAKGTFGPPSFEKTIFIIEENTSLKCTPTYLKI